MKIDAHQHFWQYNREEYSWISDQMDILKKDFLPPGLNRLLEESGFAGSIAVQARQNLEETRWLLKLADTYDLIKGVVGWVDLCSTDLVRQLNEFCQNPKFKGVRHVLHDEPDDNFMLKPEFLKGIETLKEFGLTYDLLIFEKHLNNTIEMVSKFPEQPFVVDHMAKPKIREGILLPWHENIMRLAEFPNVYCKLSGMVTEADWKHWKYEDLVPYIEVCLEAFGTDRLMVGSDWPVCTVAGEYSEVMGIVQKYINKLTDQEQMEILGTTCSDFYNI